MAIPLFLKPKDEMERKANIKIFKKEKSIQCPLCKKETIHEHEVHREEELHWITCEACNEVFEVDERGNVWKFHQDCSNWEYECDCLPYDDC